MSSFAAEFYHKMKISPIIAFFAFFLISFYSSAQHLTSEDSMLAGGNKPATFVGGYGNAFYQHNKSEEIGRINLERTVFFLGHRFNEKFSFLAEIEIEDAKVEGGEAGGELAIEQAYLKFKTSRNSFLIAGLFLPRIGIINENHLPNTYNGNERPIIERLLIPSTWRELGVGFYTSLNSLPIDISLGIMNGLNSSSFEHGTVFRGGRFEGREATANNLGFTGSIQYSVNNFIFQLSGYAAGTTAFTTREADSLRLDSGPLGTPVILGEANVQYKNNAFNLRVLGTTVSIPNASRINAAFANNTPESAYGFYAEAAYDLLYSESTEKKKSLKGFIRYEKLDLNATIPENGIIDPTLDQQHIIAGFNYLPIPNIAVKLDVRLMSTGDENPNLVINPDPNALPYQKNNTLINAGIGYSF
jgi:hypothetical protein